MTGKEFAMLRKKLNHTIDSASKALGISKRTLCYWQNMSELSKRAELLVSKLRKNK